MHILDPAVSILTNAEVLSSLYERRMKRHTLTKPLLECNVQFEIEKHLLYFLHKNATQSIDVETLHGYIEKVVSFFPSASVSLNCSDVFNLVHIRPVSTVELTACIPSHISDLSQEAQDNICALTRETFGDASVSRKQYLQCVSRNLQTVHAAQKANGATTGPPQDSTNLIDEVDDFRFVYDSAHEDDAGDRYENGEDSE